MGGFGNPDLMQTTAAENRLIEGLRSCHIETPRNPWKMAVCFQHGSLIINLPVVYIHKNAVDSGKKVWYPEFISLSSCLSKPCLMQQIFPISEGDPLSPQEGPQRGCSPKGALP